jgi:hypothetical protein
MASLFSIVTSYGIEPDNVNFNLSAGFPFSAGVVTAEELMERVVKTGTDGMAINFPD